ncbi:MAG: NYN domain-containing protein [Desulfobacterales bacterium]
MALHLLIDGYNLIRRSPELGRLDREDIARGREALLARLAAYRRLKAHRITVVFDGAGAPPGLPERDRQAGIRVLFSRGGETADQLIAQLARREGEGALVVTSDAALQRAAASSGAAAVSAEEFAARLELALSGGGSIEDPEGEPEGRRIATRKKGNARRAPRRERRARRQAEKL